MSAFNQKLIDLISLFDFVTFGDVNNTLIVWMIFFKDLIDDGPACKFPTSIYLNKVIETVSFNVNLSFKFNFSLL